MNAEEIAKRHWIWATDALKAAERDITARDPKHAVSRAYYAMLHAANAALATKGLQSKSHSGTQALFNEHLVRTGEVAKERGSDLSKGQRRRTSAEYNVSKDVPQTIGEEQCSRARQFLQEMRVWLRQAGLRENELVPVPPQPGEGSGTIGGQQPRQPAAAPPSAADAGKKAAAATTRGTGQQR